ncbi:MAG: rhodanese-like domain-containing protein [Candidatus Neomarinimicrobiota bacterium]|jgi:rhodanese-related sulfurtransferase
MNTSYILIGLAVVGFLIYNRVLSNVPSISSEESQKVISDNNYRFLDVRTDGEYSDGHIPNSIHIPLQDIQSRISEIEKIKDKKIIVYCRSGARSSMASKTLLKEGFDVSNLTGGIMSWKGEVVK